MKYLHIFPHLISCYEFLQDVTRKFLNDLYIDDSTSGLFNVQEAYDVYLNAK